MEKLLTVADIMDRYHCCRDTASKIIHQMRHITSPRLMVSESAVMAWEYQQSQPTEKKPRRSREPIPVVVTSIPRRRA